MRLKRLLKERVSRRQANKIENNCSTFLKQNKGKLQDGKFLYRGTDTDYSRDIVKKSFRKRKEVWGEPFNTWVYEHFKPSGFPSRQDMIPSEFGDLSKIWRKKGNVFCVFPIGSNYELHYTSEVRDFNSDNIYLSPLSTLDSVFYSMKSLPDGYGLNEDQIKKVEDALNYYYDNPTNTYEGLKDVFGKLWRQLKELQNAGIHEAGIKAVQVEEGAEKYFNNSSLGKTLPDEFGLEVNIYAPDGFYYVEEKTEQNEDFVRDLIKMIFE